MALKLEDKKAIVNEVNQVAASALSLVAAKYRGLPVEQMTQLRVKARQEEVYVKVVRNTLARRAVEGTEFACVKESLVGPLILAFSRKEPSAAARLIRDFMKENDVMEVTAVAIGGQVLPASELVAVAELPTWSEAVATLMSVMKAPVSKFVRTLAEPHGKLVRTLAAVRDQKQS